MSAKWKLEKRDDGLWCVVEIASTNVLHVGSYNGCKDHVRSLKEHDTFNGFTPRFILPVPYDVTV